MTIFAGALSLNSRAVPASLKASLRLNLRSVKDDSGKWCEHNHDPFFLLKWDSGAFAEPAWHETPDGSVCALAGDPLLIDGGCRLSRGQQLCQIAPLSAPMSNAEFAQCRGSFALVRYLANEKSLCLVTDAVGLRSIYYVVQDGLLVFATALRILEAIPEIRKQLSVLGMAELSTFSFPLAARTPYDGINVLRECQVLSASSSGVDLRNYYDWTVPEASSSNAAEAAAQLYASFQEAVRIRAGDDKRAYSFLSGGMDSRAIVATLIDTGRQVEALNFSSDASQDQRYAELFAVEAGSRCHLNFLPGGIFPNFSFLALSAKTELERRQPTSVDRPQMIWSGDGGSVGLGHVYMDELMLDYGARGDVKGAIKHFLDFNSIALSSRVLTAAARASLPQLMFDSVLSEVNRYPREDIGRRIYLFLLFNDQRRHLFNHFETIDQHGLELLTPFFDAQFLKAVAATPACWGVLHRLYAQFFEHLPEFALRTPWQTYPGHQPCPLPGDPNASYQWTSGAGPHKDGFVARSQLAIKMLQAFNSMTQPQVFSRPRIWLAALLHALGLRDCRHILQRLQLYRRLGSNTKAGQRSLS